MLLEGLELAGAELRSGSAPPVSLARFSRRFPTFWRSWPKPLVVAQDEVRAVLMAARERMASVEDFITPDELSERAGLCNGKNANKKPDDRKGPPGWDALARISCSSCLARRASV